MTLGTVRTRIGFEVVVVVCQIGEQGEVSVDISGVSRAKGAERQRTGQTIELHIARGRHSCHRCRR